MINNGAERKVTTFAICNFKLNNKDQYTNMFLKLFFNDGYISTLRFNLSNFILLSSLISKKLSLTRTVKWHKYGWKISLASFYEILPVIQFRINDESYTVAMIFSLYIYTWNQWSNLSGLIKRRSWFWKDSITSEKWIN